MGRRFGPLDLNEVERAELTSLASRRSTAQGLAQRVRTLLCSRSASQGRKFHELPLQDFRRKRNEVYACVPGEQCLLGFYIGNTNALESRLSVTYFTTKSAAQGKADSHDR